MSRGAVSLMALVLAVLLGGCFGVSTMEVGYGEAKAARGPLSGVSSRRIRIDVTDRRPQPGELIGFDPLGHGFKAQRGAITAQQPVRLIVGDALASELARNGHVVVSEDSAERILVVDVRAFWLDIHQGSWNPRFSGTAGITVIVADGRTAHTLLVRDYDGRAAETGGNREGNWESVMSGALERMVRQVATDPRLVEALRTP